jgi:hypothetical protein
MRDWKPMRLAKQDGTMILACIHNLADGNYYVVPACWMAPGGNPLLEGWWSAGAAVGTLSYDGLPHRFAACKITPLSWRKFPEPEPVRALRRREALIVKTKTLLPTEDLS